MRYIMVERIDKTYGRQAYDEYAFPDGTTNDEIETDKELCDAFDDFVNAIPTSVIIADGNDVGCYLENCEWWFYDLEEKEFWGIEA